MHRRLAIAFCVLALSSGGCARNRQYVRDGFLDNPPKRVAILPFAITYPYDLTENQSIPEEHELGRELLRKTFYYAFTSYGYIDMKLSDVDKKLIEKWGPLENKAWRNASPKEIGKELGVDALIYGDISRIMHFANPLYTETSLSAKLRMVDAVSGEDLWRTKVDVAERGGALVKKGQAVDFIKDQMRSYDPKVKLLRICDAASREALKKMPNPTLSADLYESAAVSDSSAIRLAILPFNYENEKFKKGSEPLRNYLASNIREQEGAFEVLEPQLIDEYLIGLGWKDGESLPNDLNLADLASKLGADMVLKGTITAWGKTYLVVESWVKAGLRLELIDPANGQAIWSEQKKSTRHSGISKIPIPTGIKSGVSMVTTPIKGMKQTNLERVADNLTQKLAQDLSSSASVLVYLDESKSND